MEFKDIKVGGIVVCNERHTDEVLWGSRCEPLVGKPMKVLETDGTGHIHCRGVEQDACVTPTVWKAEWLERYKRFEINDIVICKEKPKDGIIWVIPMDRMVGKKMFVTDYEPPTGRYLCSDGTLTYWFEPEWLEAYEEKGKGKMKKDGNNMSPIVVDENVYYGIREIIINPAKRATTVCFNDGKIICVKAGVDVERPDIYSAVTAAIGIHFAGSNNALKNIISRKTTELKPKKKGPRKEFTIEVGDLVKLTKRGKKTGVFGARINDGKDHPLAKIRVDEADDREMIVTKVEKTDDKTIAYVNVPEKVADFEFKVPVELLRITRKGE